MEIIKYPNPDEWNKLIKRPALDVSSLFGTVQKVLDEASKLHDEGKESTFDYNKYYLADSRQHEIMDEILSKKEYKFIKKESYYYNGYIMQTMLGPSPTTVDPNKK